MRLWRGLRDPLGFLTDMEARCGDFATLRPDRVFALFHPDYVRHVLQENHPNYQKGPDYRAALGPLMGTGLLTSEGTFWKRQRRLAQPAFQRSNLDLLAPPIADCTSATLEAWRDKARRSEPVALRQALTELTLRIGLLNMFSVDVQAEMQRLLPAVHAVNEFIELPAPFFPVSLPEWVPTPARVRFRKALRVIDEFVYRIVRERRTQAEPRVDLLDLLLRARDENTGEQMDNTQLRDEMVTMLNAAHDTATDAVAWTLILLAKAPEWRQQARREVLAVLGDAAPTAESMREMPLLGRIFHESLRLYPPAWGLARTATGEDRIGPYRIPAGAVLIVSPYVTHRSARYWERPEAFDPDRFLPERMEARPKFAFFPFGGGPRQCIGFGLATMEVMMIVAAILQKFDFDLPGVGTVEPRPRISLRPKGTVWLRLQSLDGAPAKAA